MPTQSSPWPVIGVVVGSFVVAAAFVAVGQPDDQAPVLTQSTPSTGAVVPTTGPTPPGPTSESPTLQSPTVTPPPTAADLEKMLAILIAQVPSGYTVPTSREINGVRTQFADVYPNADGGYDYSVGTEAYADGESGHIAVRVMVGGGAIRVVDDLCSVPGPMRQGFEEGCHMVTASNGVPVRISYRNRGGFRLVDVFAVYPGVTVWAMSMPTAVSNADNPMTEPILSEEELIELAAMPEMLPPS